MDNVVISVIMGAYNCENTIDEALNSILRQTYQNWEIIICEDASRDNTREKIEKYLSNEKIRLLTNQQNMGLAYSLNRCALIANGKYLVRMDADDISVPDRFEVLLDFLETHQEFSVVGSYMQAFSEDGMERIIPIKASPTKFDLPKFNPFHHATVMIRTDVFKELNGYRVDPSTRRAEDVDLWFRLFHRGYRGYNLSRPLYLVREDRSAIRRRTYKSSFEASYVLYRGIRELKLPIFYYIFCIKPIISQITPRCVKEIFRKTISRA